MKIAITGLLIGTTYVAASDGIVNASATPSAGGQTLTGSSNAQSIASVTGSTQSSICFPVKNGASWAVQSTMPNSQSLFFTPLS